MSISAEEFEILRQLNAPYYRNIFDIFPENDRIYGTETLCGDWSARILILAQDFSDVGCLNKRLQSAPACNPFYHDPLGGTLKGRREMIKASSEAFSITTKKLRNLQHIITLGKFAHTFLQLHFKIEPGRWRDVILERKYISVPHTELTIYPSAHTSRRGINNRLKGENWDKKWATVKDDWKYIFKAIKS